MPLYQVTPTAPVKICDKRHDGPGSVIALTESQAKHEVNLGHLKPYQPAPAKKTKA